MPLLLALILALPAEPKAKVPPAVKPEPVVKVDVVFSQVAPANDKPTRSKDQTRAVVLIHGLSVFPIARERTPGKLALRAWQQTDSVLVKQLAADADVYAFAYTQTTSVDKIHELGDFNARVVALKKAGYKEIVLIGHSAGGLVARHFVEDHPDAGVTKVIQVCAPNTGSGLAGIKAAKDAQVSYLASLSVKSRTQTLEKRKDVHVPDGVQFVCVVGLLRLGSDGIVSLSSQWSEDLQKQGVPAHLLKIAHWDAVKTAKGAEFVAKLVRDPQPRWKAEQVSEAKKKINGG